MSYSHDLVGHVLTQKFVNGSPMGCKPVCECISQWVRCPRAGNPDQILTMSPSVPMARDIQWLTKPSQCFVILNRWTLIT